MATTATSPSSREVIVTIHVEPGGVIKVTPETFWVSKKENEEVRWVCKDANDPHPFFTVDFEKNGSPFYETQFSSEFPFSGLVRREALPGPKIYKYTVRVHEKNLDRTLDPGGGIKWP